MGSVTRGPRSKTAQRLGAPLAFLDESGVLRMPTRRRTWAPAGHTPIISDHYQQTGSPPWRLSPCLPSASIWACTCGSSRSASGPRRWRTSCGPSGATCGARWCSSGTGALFTQEPPWRQCARPIPGCTWKSSQRMPRNSTLRSRSGTTAKATPPSVCCGIRGTSADVYRPMSAGSGARRRNDDHSSSHPSFHRHRDRVSIAYAKLNRRRASRAPGTQRYGEASGAPAGGADDVTGAVAMVSVTTRVPQEGSQMARLVSDIGVEQRKHTSFRTKAQHYRRMAAAMAAHDARAHRELPQVHPSGAPP